MHKLLALIAAALLVLSGCNKPAGEENTEAPGGEESESEGEGDDEGQAGDGEQATGPEADPTADSARFEGVRDGKFVSERFNVQFTMPQGWRHVADGQSADSATIEGPDGLQLIVANTQSIQLADTNFASLNDRVSFEQVNVVPDRSEARPINGNQGYRVEGDALLRGDEVPIYFISQAVSIPGEPVMLTIYIPGDFYDLHSDIMKAVLDSVEAVNIHPM